MSNEELQISVEGRLGRIALNRPRAINALSLEMIEGIKAALRGWAEDPAIGAVLFTGNGEKGFCSGGDVRAAREYVIAGRPELADSYFAAEYEMNGLIAGYGKPTIALTHGVVMGGGIGIAGHCRFRFTQPGARFAMPEAAIGFFSDVGANAILAQTELDRALLFLMSGVSVGAADALKLGLADAAIRPEAAAGLVEVLAQAASAPDPAQAIVLLMQEQSIDAGATPFCDAADRLQTEPALESAAAFIARARGLAELDEISALLDTRSPTALIAIFHAQLRARELMSVPATLALDLKLAHEMIRRPDFAEGVRAVLVDKDQAPRWSPATLEGVEMRGILAAIEGP